MKNLPLYLQVWLACIGLILIVFLVLAMALPFALRSFFTAQIYDLIKDSQRGVILISDGQGGDIDILRRRPPQSDALPDGDSGGQNFRQATDNLYVGTANDERVYTVFVPPEGIGEKDLFVKHRPGAPLISHFFIQDDGDLPGRIPEEFGRAVLLQAMAQRNEIGEYRYAYQNRTIFYVVSVVQREGASGWLVSYAWSNFRNDQVEGLWDKLSMLMIIVMLFALLPSILMARLITRPLVSIEKYVSDIACRKWDRRLHLDRHDEIGRLAEAVNQMRDQLVEHEKMERGFLQSLSHDLKTPVMLIKSYARAIEDGIHPKGTPEASAQIIEKEAVRLEKRIANILWINKVNYLVATSGQEFTPLFLNELAGDIIETFQGCCGDIVWTVKLDKVLIKGDAGQLRVLLENTLENMLRHTKSEIRVTASLLAGGRFELVFFNDGEPITEALLENIFSTYCAGRDGEFGLGLSVAKMIAEFHGFELTIANCPTGVEYRLTGSVAE
jgi:two-component system sensor histidine kinase CssS